VRASTTNIMLAKKISISAAQAAASARRRRLNNSRTRGANAKMHSANSWLWLMEFFNGTPGASVAAIFHSGAKSTIHDNPISRAQEARKVTSTQSPRFERSK
jgi:hypothetical protein